MLPVKQLYIDSRKSRCLKSSSSGFVVDLPVNITLPANTAVYITDITIPVSWYTIEDGRNNSICYRIQTLDTQIVKADIPEGNYSPTTLAQSP